MFKLVAIAGALRGEEYNLSDGPNILGRDSECQIVLPVAGVSKNHLSITVTGLSAYLEDLKSSNGTFVNKELVSRCTIKNGDKIALPNLILQVVYVTEKKIYIKKEVEANEEDEDKLFLSGGPIPESIFAKIIWLFQYKLMPVIYSINKEYEWRSLIAILLSIFCVIVIALTIFPVIKDSTSILIYETALRGAHYADEIARINRRALEHHQLDKLNTKFLSQQEGIESFRLFDLQGRIVRPMEKLNEYISDSFSVTVREWADKTRDRPNLVYKRLLANNKIGIGKKIMAYNAKLGELEAVGIIAIKFAPKSLKIANTKSSKAYLEALSTSVIIGIIFFGIVYYLTLQPLKEIAFQIDMAIRGRRKDVETRYKFFELKNIQDNINVLLQRIRELSNMDSDSLDDEEGDEKYVTALGELLRGAGVPALVLDSQKNLAFINSECEDITGIRESASQGENILDISRERGFSGTILELCENSGNSAGSHQEASYELSGHDYQVNVIALIGHDNAPKSYYVTFLLES